MAIGALLAAGIGAAGSIGSSLIASNSAKTAAADQLQATNNALNLQSNIYNSNKNLATPYINNGTNAQNTEATALGLNGTAAQQAYYNNFQNSPGYNAVLQAGTNALDNSALARGDGYSGNVAAAVSNYGGQLEQGAYNSQLTGLNNLTGQGISALGGLEGAGTNFANASGGYMTNPNTNGTNANMASGLYNASGALGLTNSVTNALNGYNNQSAFNSGKAAATGTPTQTNDANNWLSMPVSSLWGGSSSGANGYSTNPSSYAGVSMPGLDFSF